MHPRGTLVWISLAKWYPHPVTLHDELRAVLSALDQARVDYALIGALAVAVWGAPRATKDIDLLVRREDLPHARRTSWTSRT